MKPTMKMKFLLLPLLVAILTTTILHADKNETDNKGNSNNQNPAITVAANDKNTVQSSQETDEDTDILEVPCEEASTTQAPRTVIYGPIGIVLKTIEFVLKKLYILYED